VELDAEALRDEAAAMWRQDSGTAHLARLLESSEPIPA
jgi:hypothetical protein